MTTDSTRRTPNAPLREDPADAASSLGAGGSDIPAAASLQAWLVEHRNRGTTPDRVAAELVANGWDADAAARVAMRSLRSADRATLNYAALTLGAGLAGLGAAGATHLVLAGNPDPWQLTWMLSIAVVAVPITGVAGWSVREVQARSRFVMWSPSRRGWFGALALCTGAVGLVRLLGYVFAAIATLTGASDRPFTAVAAAQVAVSLAVAVPLFVWSLREWRRSNLVISALERHDREAAPPTT